MWQQVVCRARRALTPAAAMPASPVAPPAAAAAANAVRACRAAPALDAWRRRGLGGFSSFSSSSSSSAAATATTTTTTTTTTAAAVTSPSLPSRGVLPETLSRRTLRHLLRFVTWSPAYRVRAHEEHGIPPALFERAAQRLADAKTRRVRRLVASNYQASGAVAHDAVEHGERDMDAAMAATYCALVAYCREHLADDMARYTQLSALADLRSPPSWFPLARARRRKVIFHTGPTNSGKTHAALQRLRAAHSGVYCGPLRLLAWEVYDKMNREYGVACNLRTGQEREPPPPLAATAAAAVAAMASERSADARDARAGSATADGAVVLDDLFANGDESSPTARFTSCTVEMADVHRPVDVAVVDEVQMIGNADRGGAWTRAILGLPADELHLCGDGSALELIRELIVGKCQEEFEVRGYHRLSPLTPARRALGAEVAEAARAGDCFVAFSKHDLFRIKHRIERRCAPSRGSLGGRNGAPKCAVIYGSLPPETRRQQARLFNEHERTGHSVLVATDAIGMGLNLAMRRVVFSSLEKFDGVARRPLTVGEILQIAGRAGRYGGRYPVGRVAALNKRDAERLNALLGGGGGSGDYEGDDVAPAAAVATAKPEVCERAGLQPTFEMLEAFAAHDPDAPLSRLLEQFEGLARVEHEHYFVCDLADAKTISRMLERAGVAECVPLSVRFTVALAPLKTEDAVACTAVVRFVRALGAHGVVRLHASAGNSIHDGGGNGSSIFSWLSKQAALDVARERRAHAKRAAVEHDADCALAADAAVVNAVAPRRHGGVRTVSELSELESLYHVLDLYTWLAHRFEDAFVDGEHAAAMRARCADESSAA